jgi:hypothetical protein
VIAITAPISTKMMISTCSTIQKRGISIAATIPARLPVAGGYSMIA